MINSQDPEKRNLDLLWGIVNGGINNKLVKTKKDDPSDIVEKLRTELKVVEWAIDLHKIAHEKPGYSYTGKLSKDDIWKEIESNYPKISNGLGDQLNRILEGLRRDLKYKDTSNPWKAATPGWWDELDYREVNKPL